MPRKKKVCWKPFSTVTYMKKAGAVVAGRGEGKRECPFFSYVCLCLIFMFYKKRILRHYFRNLKVWEGGRWGRGKGS